MKIKRALLSVSDKTGLVAFAKELHALGIEIISTGGTMKTLREAGIPVTYVSDVTGFPEIMDGRVKTLNPLIHGGILAIRDNADHVAAMEKHGIGAIDLVAVNLYPFRQTVAKPDATLEEAVENIDIGGPAMIRAAAKNFAYVTVVVNPARYGDVVTAIRQGEVSLQLRMELAKEAYSHTAEYDAAISGYLAGQCGEGLFPEKIQLVYEKSSSLRYGENPHQEAAFYRTSGICHGIAAAQQLHGKELSFNNLVDLDAAWNLVSEFSEPAAVIIKHTNPCGTGTGATLAEAYQKAFDADPVSAFGGIIALNKVVDQTVAEKLSTLFVEAVIAPAFTVAALDILTAKKNVRILEAALPADWAAVELDVKKISGGLLLQQADTAALDLSSWQTVTKRAATDEEMNQLVFAWKVVKHVKSNAIVIAGNNQTLGVGAGQMNRVGSAEIAIKQAGDKAKGAVMSSDAFFPFADTVERAAQAGITAIIQPGGSMRDEDSIEAADKHGIAMIFTGMRHFKH